jgi:hypothetical protein
VGTWQFKLPVTATTNTAKATAMSHLRKKYSQELEYMLQNFKSERQLLGGPSEESGGSEASKSCILSFSI